MEKSKIIEIISRRVAKEFKNGNVVNLGIGVPTFSVNYIPEGVKVLLHSENGFVGMGGTPEKGKEIKNIINAGGMPVTIEKGGSFFDSSMSFSIIRGGHVDITVLGALQVDEKGNLANWMIHGKKGPGMCGAMDLVVGAKRVIIAMEHTVKGKHKILKECTFPLTAKGQVNMIITEMGVIKVIEKGLVLTEKNPMFSFDEIQEATGAKLYIEETIRDMEI